MQVQPLQSQGNLAVGTLSAPPNLGMGTLPQQQLSTQQPEQPVLSNYSDNPNDPTQNVAPLDGQTTAKMVAMLSQAQKDYPGQEEQILNQFVADNQTKYPAQMAKVQGFLGTNDGSRIQRNNNPTAMTTDVAQSLGLLPGVDYIQGDPFKDKQGETLYTAKLLGADPISSTIQAFDKAAQDGTSIFMTAKGKPRWSYINMTNSQWEAMTPQQKLLTVQHMANVESGPNGSAMQPSGFKPKDVLNSLIADNQPQAPTPTDNSQPQDRSGNFFQRLGSDLQKRYGNLQESTVLTDAGKQGPVAMGFQILGQLAGTATDVVGEGLTSAYRDAVPQVFQQGIQNAGNMLTPTIGKMIQPYVNQYSQFKQDHPVGAKNLEAGANIANAILQFYGGKKALPSEQALSDATDAATWERIQPTLSASEQAAAVKSGAIQSKGIMGTITHVATESDQPMIDAAKPYVLTAKSPIEAVANMQQGIADQATALQKGLDDTGAIFNKSQVKGALAKLEPPLMVSSDTTLNNAYQRVIAKLVDLTPNGGKLGGLLQVRKDFDAFIARQFPNLYNSDALTPMKSAIRDVRGAINDVIDSRLPNGTTPDGISFRQSLKNQSLLYDAIDNVSTKVQRIGTQTGVLGSALKLGKGLIKPAMKGVGLGAFAHLVP